MNCVGATFLSKEVGSVHRWPGCDDALSVASELTMAIPAGWNCWNRSAGLSVSDVVPQY